MQIGWTAASSNSLAFLNKTNYVEGNGSIELTIKPNSNNHFSGAIIKSVNKNLSNATNFYFWFYIQNASKLKGGGNWGVTLLLSNEANYKNYFQCGILSGGMENGWNPIVIARSQCQAVGNPSWKNNISSIEFEVNLAAASKKIKYTSNVITNFDNLRYSYAGGAFDRAQVILTFDGAWNSTLYNATPIMQANNQTGVAFIVTNDIGENLSAKSQKKHDYNYDCGISTPCITKKEITDLHNDGWDISSHTVNHANLVTDTSDDYKKGIKNNFELANSFATLNNLGFTNNAARFFAYPNGAYNSVVINQIKQQGNYIFSRALGYGITQPNLFIDSPYNLSDRVQSIPMTPSVTANMVEGYINQVITENGLLVLTFHIIQGKPQGNQYTSIEYSTANFTIISNYLRQKQDQGLLRVTNLTSYYARMNESTTTSTSTSSTSTTSSSTSTSTTI